MSNNDDSLAITVLKDLAQEIHHSAVDHGWWQEEDDILAALEDLSDVAYDASFVKTFQDKVRLWVTSTKLALIHSEVSEGLEGLRHGNPPSDHIPAFSAIEEEAADCLIRLLDLCERRGYRLAEAMVEKIRFNQGRAYKHGGKAV